MSDLELFVQRCAAATEEWERYDFGSAEVEACDGWENRVGETTVFRTIYLANDEDPALPSVRAHFTVCFQGDTADVEDVYAITHNGNIFGERPSPASAMTP